MTDGKLGQPVLRKEDARLLTGRGRFTDDEMRDGQAFVFFLRSPYAHAVIKAIDAGAARAMPGVAAVLTAAEATADGLGLLPNLTAFESYTGETAYVPPRPLLAAVGGRVRYVGDPVAVVVADTLEQAKDAAELIEVDYDELPAVTDTGTAAGGERLWPERDDNVCVHWQNRDPAEVAPLFDAAKTVARVDIVNNRVMANPLEPRGALAEYDPATNVTTLYTQSQGIHRMHMVLWKFVFACPAEHIRVVSGAVGGAFGVRSKVIPEQPLLIWAAKKLGRAVKWRADRAETMIAENHGRDNVSHARAAFDADGRIRALWIETVASVGAYLSEMAPISCVHIGPRITGTVYDVPMIYHSVKAVFTNNTPVDTYRGAGRPEAAYLMERLMDQAGRDTGLGAIEIRRRNFIAESALPYTNYFGMAIDSGEFERTLDKGLAGADWHGFEARRAEARGRGMLRGIGMSFFLEGSGGQPDEEARIEVHADARVSAFVGTFSHGQGHQTAFAQVIGHKLGVGFANIDLFDAGDTTVVPFGRGTSGSRSMHMGGNAIAGACDAVIAKATRIAAHLMQADPGDVSFAGGGFAAGDAAVTLADVAAAAGDPERLPDGMAPGLDETFRYARDPSVLTYPNGCHIAEVEIDPETGLTRVVNYTAVDDNGVVVNPMIVHGQGMGGIAQGLGQALLEETIYDPDNGQFMSASFMDYGIPRAEDMPPMKMIDHPVPCTTNALGVKGAGESGTCGAPPAIVNAALDALAHLGVKSLDMPLTPQKIWRAIGAAK